VSRHITEGAIQDHGRAALAYAVDVQLVAAHVDHLTGWRMCPLVAERSDGLVDRSEEGKNQEEDD
jgi:hypothetical protein